MQNQWPYFKEMRETRMYKNNKKHVTDVKELSECSVEN